MLSASLIQLEYVPKQRKSTFSYSMENSHLGLDEGQFSLSFKWTDSTSLRLAQKHPFPAALLDEIESSVGLSTEQSSCSEVLLFSVSDVEESDNEEETDKQKNANLDTILDFVPCSQPDYAEGTSHHDHSPLKNLEDASVNRSGRPVRAASLGVAQYLVAAKEAASSRACVEAGPRGLRTKSQKRTVSQTAMRRSQAESCMPRSGVVQTSTQLAPPLTSRSLLLPQYVADFEKLPLRYLQGKDRRMSKVDRAVAPGYQKRRRLDIVLVQGEEMTGDEVVQDLQVEVDEKEQKKVDAERRKREREQKPDEKRKEKEDKKRKQEERERAAEEKKHKAAEDKQRRDAECAEAKRKKEEERAATQASRPRRSTKRKAPEPDMWDDGTTCPCGQDVGTGKTENWA